MRIVLAGALGEVGRTLHVALNARGHDVIAVSSRAPLPGHPDVVGLAEVTDLLATSDIDALVQAGGPGDHRATDRDAIAWSRALLNAWSDRPAVLISTTRVLEGYDTQPDEGAPGNPRTQYAHANTDHEDLWLERPQARVLRLVNFFGRPSEPSAPQNKLLPWSLLREGWEQGAVDVRSQASTWKEFVSADDVVRAIELLVAEPLSPPIVTAAPGFRATLQDLVDASARACESAGGRFVTATFGSQPASQAWSWERSWLARQGWSSELSLDRMTEEMTGWLVEWGSTITDSGRDRG